MKLVINGLNITPYLAYKSGFSWARNDVDGPNAGRDLDSNMVRDRVGTKDKINVTLIPVDSETLARILEAIEPEWVTVSYDSPRGQYVTKVMYSNNAKAKYRLLKQNGKEYWAGITFPLVER